MYRDHPTRKDVVLGGGNGCTDCAFDKTCEHKTDVGNFYLDTIVDKISEHLVVRCKRKKYPEELEK